MSKTDISPFRQAILSLFTQINQIPRCSGNEKQISDWLVSWGTRRGIPVDQDEFLNICMRVEATTGFEDAPTVTLQGHMDMVCEKMAESSHDFTADPIAMTEDGDWLTADGTTLGADNGIAIAIALAFVESGLPHPALEVLITVDEETGLTGAMNLASGWLKGRQLINLDSEDEGVFTVGCAGGRTTITTLPVERQDLPKDWVAREVTVSGLQGGHSGVDIHQGWANANVIMARVLRRILAEVPVRVHSIRGGKAHNAIPRDAQAVVCARASDSDAIGRIITLLADELSAECRVSDPGFKLMSVDVDRPASALTAQSTGVAVRLIAALPHGVIRMSDDVPGLVETSTNVAQVAIAGDVLRVVTSQRSSSDTRLSAIGDVVDAISELAGASIEVTSRHPAWEPDMDSTLLARASRVYRHLFDREPVVEGIHAGLECGVIGAEYSGMEMISIGPTVKQPHSPDERLLMPTLDDIWRFLAGLLESYREA